MILTDTVDGALDLVFEETVQEWEKKTKAYLNGLFFFHH